LLHTNLIVWRGTAPASDDPSQFRAAPNGTWYKLDSTQTLAYEALSAMEKRPGSFGPKLAVTPSALVLMVDVDEPQAITTTLLPWNAGFGVLTWTASAETGLQITPTLVVTTGFQNTPLTMTIETTGYTTGTFIGNITVTATTTDVLFAPQVVSVTVRIVPEIYRAYLPLTLRATP
jgi:hypothetical protein